MPMTECPLWRTHKSVHNRGITEQNDICAVRFLRSSIVLEASVGTWLTCNIKRVQMGFESYLFSPFAGGEQFFKLAARFQIDQLALATMRAQALMDIPAALAHCSSPDDILTEQVRYWQIAQRQYAQALSTTVEKAVAAATLAEVVEIEPIMRQRDYLVVKEPAGAVEPAVPLEANQNAAPPIRRSA